MDFPSRDLSLQHISQSYQTILQQHGEYLLDGLGNVVIRVGPDSGSIDLSELVPNSSTASMSVESASYSAYSRIAETASIAFFAEAAETSSFSHISAVSIESLTASLASTASFALTASFLFGSIESASFAANAATASYAPNYIRKAGDIATGDIIGTDFVKTRSGTITRDGSGRISQVELLGGRTLVVSRVSGYISSVTDGSRTWEYVRDSNNQIESWSVI